MVVPGFASPEEVSALRARAEALVDSFDPATVSIFSTKDDNQVGKLQGRLWGGSRGGAWASFPGRFWRSCRAGLGLLAAEVWGGWGPAQPYLSKT